MRPRRLGSRLLTGVGTVAILLSFAAASPAWALAISQAYVLSSWSTPTSATGTPFVLTVTSGYQLLLDSTGVAASATALSEPLSIQIRDRLYYQSHTGTIDPYEGSASGIGARANAELARLDDSGVVNESIDDPLNVDFTNNSAVKIRAARPDLGVPDLVIFEDAGLDPFSLSACGSSSPLFNGFSSSALSTLLGSGGLGTDDSAPGIDQAFWFVFDRPVAGGCFTIAETDNFGGSSSEKLEIDFVGTSAVARVPEPATLLLLGSALAAVTLARKRRR
jgi:hypothetical protein